MCKDVSHIHYFLESEFGYTDVRQSDLPSCKTLLKSQSDNRGFLFYFYDNRTLNLLVSQLKSFDCSTQQVQVHNPPQLANIYEAKPIGVQFCAYDKDTFYLSGGYVSHLGSLNTCNVFKISTNTLERRENMNVARGAHGLQKIDQKIFAFGGQDGWHNIKSAEVYDIVKNQWKNLPDMPKEGNAVTCDRV